MHETEESNSSAPLMRRGDLIHNVVEGTVEQYKVLDFLGKGGFGECFAAESALMRNYVAIKVVSKLRLKDRQTQKIFREIDIHRLAHHPNIVRMFDAFQDRSNFYMVMELCKASSLLNLINDEHMKKGNFDEWQGSRYVNQLCDAVIYLAKRNIIHRDLKPGNVLIAHNGDIKLGDFGLASKMEHLTRGSVSGTPNYLAPEVICKEGHSLASEVWSIGCLIYCMLVGKPPFESDSVESTYDRIRKGHYSYPDRPDVSFNAKELIRECLHPNPESRVGIYWIIDYIWLQNTRGGGYPLMRAKSTGNIIPKDINGNQCQLPRYLRPKSAMMNSSVPDRSRRKSFTASHDSGFGSESDMFRTSNAAFHNLIEKIGQYVDSIKNVRANSLMLSPSTMPPVAIAKWVDYSNRRGFGCKLTDGTLTVKFNEGACLSWPSNSEYLLYTSQPFATPKFLTLAGSLTPTEKEHLETAEEYGEYMDRELQGLDLLTDSCPKSLSDSIYIVYHHLDAHHLLVMFNNGLIQMTLLDSKTKLIFWKEDTDRHVGVAILTRDKAPSAYRIVPLDCREIFRPDDSMVPIRPPIRIYEMFGEAIALIEQDLLRLSTPRAVQVTSC